jgi:bifunctional DNA-binding transcriptional regulator/antitoxin component of YhaV-PrlF toxin-antitoxin module
MQQVASITSKRQLTIPAKIFKAAGFKIGDKVLVSVEGSRIRIESALSMVKKLAGSVKVPTRYRGLSEQEIMKKAQQDYWQSR